MPPSGHQPVASGPVSAARAGTPGRRTWPQRLLITFNVFLIVTCLVIAGGLGYFNYKFGRLPTVAIDPSVRSRAATLDPAGVGIEDPIGMGREVYASTAARLRELIAARLQELDR